MHLAIGLRFGTYETLALIGVGGMGEVYRARDHKLGRDVAIKVLAASYADPDRLAREIKRVLQTDARCRSARRSGSRGRSTGQPTIVADGVWVAALAGRATFSVSDNGTLTYVNAALWNNQLAWFDRRDALLGELGPPDRHAGQMPDLSPDGRRVAIARGIWSQEQVWLLDANDATPTRVTFDSVRALSPIWSSDSRRVM